MVNLVKITKLKNANLALILFEKTVVKMQKLHLFWNLAIKSTKNVFFGYPGRGCRVGFGLAEDTFWSVNWCLRIVQNIQ